MISMIPHNQPLFGEGEMIATQQVIANNYLAAGPMCEKLEQNWAKTVGTEDAATVSSGLSALRLGLKALGVQPGDEVIISAYNCVALHNAILTIGAVPVLADIERDTLCLDPVSAISRVTSKTRAIITVHMFGHPAKVAPLRNLGIPVIEDMCHALLQQGADLAITSFYPTKLIGSTGGGLVSGPKELIDKVKDLRTYGNKEPSLRQNDLFNDVGAAIALSKFSKLEFDLKMKIVTAQYYDKLLRNVETVNAGIPYRYVVRLNGHTTTDVTQAMQIRGVQAMAPVTDYRLMVDWPRDLPEVDETFRHIVSLPFYAHIAKEDQETVVRVLGECING